MENLPSYTAAQLRASFTYYAHPLSIVVQSRTLYKNTDVDVIKLVLEDCVVYVMSADYSSDTIRVLSDIIEISSDCDRFGYKQYMSWVRNTQIKCKGTV